MRKRRWYRVVSLLILPLWLQACGEGSSPTGGDPFPPPTPTPTPAPVTSVIAEGNMSGVEPFFLVEIPFTTQVPGTIEITVDWTFPEDDVDIFLVQGSCTIEEFNDGTCSFAAFSTSATAKPERIELANAQPAAYNLYVGNLGPETESFSFQVLLTSTASASSRPATREGSLGSKGAFSTIRRP